MRLPDQAGGQPADGLHRGGQAPGEAHLSRGRRQQDTGPVTVHGRLR